MSLRSFVTRTKLAPVYLSFLHYLPPRLISAQQQQVGRIFTAVIQSKLFKLRAEPTAFLGEAEAIQATKPNRPRQILDMSSYITSLPKAHCADVKSLASAILDISPSCIEFCWDRPEFFVVGSYHLDETIKDSEKEKSQEEINEESEQPASSANDRGGHQRANIFPENDVQDWGEEAPKEPENEALASEEKGKGRAANDDNVDEDGEE